MTAGLAIGAVLLIYGTYETFRGFRDEKILNRQTEGEVTGIREIEFNSKVTKREAEQIPTINYVVSGKEYSNEFHPALHKAKEMYWVGKKYTVNYKEDDPNKFDLEYGKKTSFIYLICIVAGAIVMMASI